MKFSNSVFAIVVLLAGSLPAVGQAPAGDLLTELTAARARWEAAQDGSYRYAYRKHCDCYRDTPPLTVVTVSEGTITRVYHLHEDSAREVPAREGSLDLYWTVDDLFDKIDTALGLDAVVRASFDQASGYPASMFIDYDPGLVGDETDLRLSEFEPF